MYLNPLFLFLVPLLPGFILDLIFGDPHKMPHPVRLMGKSILRGEAWLRTCFSPTSQGETRAGILLTVLMVFLSFLLPAALLFFAFKISIWMALGLETFMCYQLLAMKSLKKESMKVYEKLREKDVEGAGKSLAMIVGRDTASLDQEGITRAAVETVAENTSDGVIAPLLFMGLGGAPLGFLYKGVNTLDSMIGYRNNTYLNFGRFAARLDDVLNFIPARISAGLMIAAAWVLRMDWRGGIRIFRRDRFCHASPNSAQTEAVCAGALGVQLAGDAYYFGTLYSKPTIGDPVRPIEVEDIKRTNHLLYATALLCLPLCLAIRMLICYFVLKTGVV